VDGTIRFRGHTSSFSGSPLCPGHAGLFIAVCLLADTLNAWAAAGWFTGSPIVAGTWSVILLEGLVVSIQIVRLEYYEFMSKFFHGGGSLQTFGARAAP